MRGRGPRDNIILIDDIPYDRAVHFDQSLGQEEDIGGGGRFSIFGQNVIGQAEFSPGGWRSDYGGSNGSLLKIGIAEGNRDTPFFSAKIDLAGGELLYDGPSYVFDNTSVLLSMRFYDFGQFFDIIGQEDIGAPELQDFLFRSVTRINPETTLDVIFLYTPEKYRRDVDNVIASPDLEDPTLFRSKQDAGLLGITLGRLVGDTGEWKNIVYYRWAKDNSAQGEAFPLTDSMAPGPGEFFLEEDIVNLGENEKEIGWRSDYSVNNGIGRFAVGLRLSYLDVDFDQFVTRDYPIFEYRTEDFGASEDQQYVLLTPELYDSSYKTDGVRAAGYIEQTFDFDAVTLIAGVRVEHDGFISSTKVSPRLQLSWDLGDRLRLSASAGTYYQAPRFLQIAANETNLDLKFERTAQASAGFEYLLGGDYVLQGEFYYQDLSDLITDYDRVTGIYTNGGEGWAAGMDWIVRKEFSNRWSASVRYSYNKTRIDDGDGEGSRPSQFNRPHLGNVTVNYELNDSWSFGAQYQIASGRPSDTFVIHDDVYSDAGLLRYSREITNQYTGRYPVFQTLNIRVDYSHQIGKVVVKAFIDIVNVFGRKNINSVNFSPVTGKISNDGLGIFPQIGFSVEL